MKRVGYLFLFLLGYIPFLYAQEPADTVRTIHDVEVWGRYLSGLSGGTVRQLRVEDQLSSASVSMAEAFRQLPSVVTDIEGGVLSVVRRKRACGSMAFHTDYWKSMAAMC